MCLFIFRGVSGRKSTCVFIFVSGVSALAPSYGMFRLVLVTALSILTMWLQEGGGFVIAEGLCFSRRVSVAILRQIRRVGVAIFS